MASKWFNKYRNLEGTVRMKASTYHELVNFGHAVGGDEDSVEDHSIEMNETEKRLAIHPSYKKSPFVIVTSAATVVVVVLVFVCFMLYCRPHREILVSSELPSTPEPAISTDEKETTTAPTSATTVPTSTTSAPTSDATVPGCLDVCRTAECQDAAAYLKSIMDPSVNPCDNFHEFTCGRWNLTEKIPDDLPAWGVFEKLQRDAERNISDILASQYPAGSEESATSKARRFYRSCIRKDDSAAHGFDTNGYRYDGDLPTQPPDQALCLPLTIKYFPEAVDRLYVEENFPKGTKLLVEMMIAYVREAFISIINSAEWITSPTKAIAMAKAQNIKSTVGYSDRLYDNDWLNGKYKKVKLTDSFTLNQVILNSWSEETAREARALALSSNGTVAPLDDTRATDVNAFYITAENTISFPAAILHRPFCSVDYPYYLNFGAAATVVGHEVTHGFVDYDLPYDVTYVLLYEWDAESKRNFHHRVRQMQRQYSSFSQMGLNLNGVQTTNEDIADNGGLKEAFYAYRQYVQSERRGVQEACLPDLPYSPEQLFFIANAQMRCKDYTSKGLALLIELDTHSPERFRTIGPMQNFDEFAKTFNCPPGTYMNPEQKNNVW